MTRGIAVAGTLLAAVMLAGVVLTPVTLVRVADGEGAILFCARISASTPVTLTFTHSMYGGDVSETYVASAGSLRRTGIVTGNAAAAEYYAWDGKVRRVEGGYEVLVPEESFTALPFRIDEIGNHQLTVENDTRELAQMVDAPTQAWLSIVSRPLLTQLFGSRC
jgi:hypothetical protein